MKIRALAVAGIAALAVYAIPAAAHHSFAMFDASKTVTLEGSVKEFQWTNPHAWIMLNVANQQGQAEQWAIELNGPSGLARDGLTQMSYGGQPDPVDRAHLVRVRCLHLELPPVRHPTGPRLRAWRRRGGGRGGWRGWPGRGHGYSCAQRPGWTWRVSW